jgi:hypothetical protein
MAELMSMEHWRNDTAGVNPKCWEKELPHWRFVHQKSSIDKRWIEPGCPRRQVGN